MPSKMTRDLAQRAGMDHGNESMHASGRSAWNEEDYNAAVLMLDTLWPLCPHKIDKDEWCFHCNSIGGAPERASSQTIF